jgi:polysaccharide export outer membrane protein
MVEFLRRLSFFALLSLTSFADTSLADEAAPDKPTAAQAPTAYLVQPGDVLEISVWKEKDLQREVLVRPDGGLSFPLAGDIQASGKTIEDLRKELVTRLQKYIPDPVVTISMRQITGHKIYVIGKVNRPGEYTAVRQVDVVQALSMAGGLTPYASANNIKVLRRVNGVETAIPFRYGKIESGDALEENILLQGGDVVVVP